MARPGQGLPVIQINLHHSKTATAILTKAIAEVPKIIALIQEPWINNNVVNGLGSCGKLFHSTSQDKIRTCIIIKGIHALFIPQVSTGDHTVIQARIPTEQDQDIQVVIGSIYMPYDSDDLPPSTEVVNILQFAKTRNMELLLGCDANSHHTGWGSTNTNQRGENLHNFIMTNELILFNRGSEPTFMDRRRQEFIDTIGTGT